MVEESPGRRRINSWYWSYRRVFYGWPAPSYSAWLTAFVWLGTVAMAFAAAAQLGLLEGIAVALLMPLLAALLICIAVRGRTSIYRRSRAWNDRRAAARQVEELTRRGRGPDAD